jgi:serine/threonine-protein kinase
VSTDSPSVKLDQIGAIISDTYCIERLLGKGGMGAVYLARHVRLPRQVAIKFLLADAVSDPTAFARFRREAEITSSLHHPNILEVQDFNQLSDGTPYLVMEFLEGEDLDARLQRQGRLSVPETLAIAKAVGAGLQAAHKRQIVHRDLKPGNIFLVRVEQGDEVQLIPKILDFGISKIRQADSSAAKQTQDRQLLGTPLYMSPEQARGNNSLVDERTDQWALAVIVYQCLTGAPPFLADDLPGVLLKVVSEAPMPVQKLNEEVPPAIDRVLARALHKEREERFPSVAEFVKALCESQGSGVISIDGGRSPVAAQPRAGVVSAEPSEPTVTGASLAKPALPATIDRPVEVAMPTPALAAVAEASRRGASPQVMIAAEIPVGPPRAAESVGEESSPKEMAPSIPASAAGSGSLSAAESLSVAESSSVATPERRNRIDRDSGSTRTSRLWWIPALVVLLAGGGFGVRAVLLRSHQTTQGDSAQRRMAEQILSTDKSPAGVAAAIRLLKEAEQQQPSAEGSLLLSQAYELQSNRGEAVSALRVAIERAATMTERARLQLALAQLLTRLGQTKEACETLHMMKREVAQGGGELVTSAQILATAIRCSL